MPNDHLPASAPLTTSSAGTHASIAIDSVVRVLCPTTESSGTGFLHKSGWIITAEHVVRGSQPEQTVLRTSAGVTIEAAEIRVDRSFDLAIIKPKSSIKKTPLQICSADSFAVGAQISTWGFPFGYTGLSPMLTIGYLSGAENINGGKTLGKI